MSKYTVCILDDKLPVNQLSDYIDDTTMLNRNNFKHLLSLDEQDWEEQQLYQLINNLYDKIDDYELFGFTNHSLLFNYIEENIFSPDIVIFDWDVGETDPKQNLLNILQKKYCMIAIYTGADKKDEVENILSHNDFDEYRDRLFKIKKEDEHSVEKLDKEINEKLKLFSFKLNKTLKQNTIQGIDDILINIGELSFNQFVSLFGEEKDGTKELAKIDFIDIFLEKLKYELTSIGLNNVELKTPNEDIKDINKIRKLWHYRMYHKTGDDIIRKGDVLKKDEEYFLVLSSDCHLDEFWNKNLGYLILLKLHKIDKSNEEFKKRLNYRKNSNLNDYKLSSLVNPSPIEFLTVLPSLVNINSTYFDYALNPKELSSLEINLPEDKNVKQKLLINHIDGYKKYISISEPFISALFLFISQKFSGFGLPDFSEKLRQSVTDNIKKLKKTK